MSIAGPRRRFVVCGEALIDLMPQSLPSSEPGEWTAYSGGGPFNTVTALAKLGEEAHFLGRLSNDAFGQQLEQHLLAAGVQLDMAVSTADATSLAVVSLDSRGKASYFFHLLGTSSFNWQRGDFPELESGDWLHFGSIGSVIGPGAPFMLEFVRDTTASVSFDINVRPSTMTNRARYLDSVSALMATVGRNNGLVKASDEDIAWLTDDGSNPLEYAHEWVEQYDLSMFVVTLGADGAAAVLPGGEIVRVSGRAVSVVDTVGAGDTFMAGFLSAYAAKGKNVESSLRRGAAAAAIVCARAGAQPPTAAEVDTLLASIHR